MKYNRDEKLLRLIGKRIRELRQKQGISQSQLAFESGIRINQIGRIERGEINTGISTLLSVAKALDVPIKELFNFPY